MEKEIWKDVPGYEGLYQVSNLGRVKSLSRKIWGGRAYYMSKERILSSREIISGYLKVDVYKNYKKKTYLIHQLEAITFLGYKPSRKIVIDHINHNKLENRLENLQIISNRENSSKDKWRYNKLSRYVGVSWNKDNKKWVASIKINNKGNHIGYFNNEEQAVKAYQEALSLHNQGKSIQPVKEKYKKKYSSKYKGVCFNKRLDKWAAYITNQGKRKHLGYFLTEEEAHNAILILK